MKSNGFGSFKQKIVVHIDQGLALPFENHSSFANTGTIDGRHTFVWSRLSTRKGDDEGATSHLSSVFKDIPENAWHIDWGNSQY
ncbi:hypothetical protein [Agrobacterium bohemicum]|uniref:Uncharacterized protein n=1 Tax=Agrobacterium bohemicum TaxID=2052828 RepID=A0A135P2Z7_9HYPH|nr:hypothetical protein [Agrobacterium bohemicum]KXG85793.1 hypothetical protein ATO67_03925 [Agrobacterium bohemicum]